MANMYMVKRDGKWYMERMPSKPPKAQPVKFKVRCVFDATRITLLFSALTQDAAVRAAKRSAFGKGALLYEVMDLEGHLLSVTDVMPKTQAELDRDRLNHRTRMQGGLL